MTSPQAWTAVLRPARGAARARVVALPHAGAGPNSLAPLLKLLPAAVEVVGVTLPGRERRMSETLVDTPEDPRNVVRAVLGELRGMPALPTVYFGHSMGSLLATALALEAPDLCEGLVLSAPPDSGMWAGRHAGAWDEDALLDVLRRGGGTPAEVLVVPFLRERALNVLRHDLILGARLRRHNAGRVPSVPLTVLTGEGDALVTGRGLPAVPGNRQRAFPGGHFYLLDHVNSDAVAAEIVASFAQRRNGGTPTGEDTLLNSPRPVR